MNCNRNTLETAPSMFKAKVKAERNCVVSNKVISLQISHSFETMESPNSVISRHAVRKDIYDNNGSALLFLSFARSERVLIRL
jgi:hypothetical protein